MSGQADKRTSGRGEALVFDCGGKVLDLNTPKVMGILNVTPDSFYDGGRYLSADNQLKRAGQMVKEGAAVIDVGAVSTRPGARDVSEEEEMKRLLPVIERVSREFSEVVISADTFRSSVARRAAEHGAGMINDIYGGRFDPGMAKTVAGLNLPYVLMHMKGTPSTMQEGPEYSDVIAEVSSFFREQVARFPAGYSQIIVDPGFGFGKSGEHNFRLLAGLDRFLSLGFPVMAGLSRKSMINRTLCTGPGEALNGTTVLNTIALMKGASLLRVHDVKEAAEAVRLVETIKHQMH